MEDQEGKSEEGGLSNSQKLMIAVAGVFAAGFFMVGSNKESTNEEKKIAAMIRDVANMQRIAHKKCPMLIKQYTGTQIMSLVSNSETDKSTYLTLEWKGDKDDNFKTASCTLSVIKGGISKLVIDGKNIIDKE
ncbi:MAG: hypothetical protein KAG19_07650 [Methylococcales bacterium]|nr:hypothetical protein [Methylococcales bacterium]